MFSYISATFDLEIGFRDLETSRLRWTKPIFDIEKLDFSVENLEFGRRQPGFGCRNPKFGRRKLEF